MRISLPTGLKEFIDSRVRCGLYRNSSDVIRPGLRALAREEVKPSVQRFEALMASLPQETIGARTERELERMIRNSRKDAKRKVRT